VFSVLRPRLVQPPPTRQHRNQRRDNENGDQPNESPVTQQVSLSKADDIEGEHEQREALAGMTYHLLCRDSVSDQGKEARGRKVGCVYPSASSGAHFAAARVVGISKY
jgi:hypothetical protein